MNKIKLISLSFVSLLTLSACSKVEPGHVGIKVSNWGGDAGVSAIPLGVGYYYAGPGVEIYEYPIFTSTYTWTSDTNESSNLNEQFLFQDENGVTLTGSIAVAYHVEADKAPVLFQKYRTDMDGIIEGPVRNAVRSALIEQASNLTVDQIYGPAKTKLINAVQAEVQAYFAPFGLVVDQLYWASSIGVPDTILAQINLKTANEQAALAAEASVATSTAQANQKIAEATGTAKSIQIVSAAIASNPQILQYTAIKEWNGVLPQVTSGATPFVNLSDLSQSK